MGPSVVPVGGIIKGEVSPALRCIVASTVCFIAVCGLVPSLAKAQTTARIASSAATYVIQPGDSLYTIAARYFHAQNDWTVLRQVNRVENVHHLLPGAVLRVPTALLRRERLAAVVVATSGPAQRVTSDDVVLPVKFGMSVDEGDRLHTGNDGFITLEFEDGTHISIPQGSTVEISTLSRAALTNATDRVIFLQQGEIDSEVAHARRADDHFQIRSPSVVAGVRGTRFRVNYDERQEVSTITVTEGTVAVDATNGDQVTNASTQFVPAAFGSVVDSRGGRTDLIRLLQPPGLVDPEKVQDGPGITFELEQSAGASAYRVQIARDADLLDVLHDKRVGVAQASFGDLPDGNYFVRISCIDSNGLEGLSKIYAFERRKLGVDTSVSNVTDRIFAFRWRVEGPPGKTRFRFVLARSPDLQGPVVDQPDAAANGLVVTNLRPGLYYWAVIAEQFENGRLYQKSGDIHSFELNR